MNERTNEFLISETRTLVCAIIEKDFFFVCQPNAMRIFPYWRFSD